jgi:glyoxylase-like metal-dependent hydrolase (beta-lactamase superfamily II)
MGNVVRIHERIWQIQAPFGPDGLVMLYLLRGSKTALVDTGTATNPVDDVRPALKDMGLNFSDVDYILNTHGHLDHGGGNFNFKKDAPNTVIHMHSDDQPFADSHEYHRTFMTEFLHQFGRSDLAPAREAVVLKMIGEGDAGVDRLLADGDRLDLGAGMELSVIHTPGHTPGSVCFYWESEKLLLSGDAVQGRGSRGGGWPLYFNSVTYGESIARLQQVAVDTIAPGHGFQTSLPLNTPLKRGAEAKVLLDESADVHKAIDEAVRAQVKATPNASNLEIAQGATQRVLTRIPTLLDPNLMIPGAGPTLWGHIQAARGS